MDNAARRRGGRPPKGPEAKRGHFNARLGEALKARLQAEAAKARRSLSEEIERRLARSFEEIEDQFGGRQGLDLAILLYASFQFAGGQRAARDGHADWSLAEWLRDPQCYEAGLAATIRTVWDQHPGDAGFDAFKRFLQGLHDRALSRAMSEEFNARREPRARRH